jgi:hypothetical protein
MIPTLFVKEDFIDLEEDSREKVLALIRDICFILLEEFPESDEDNPQMDKLASLEDKHLIALLKHSMKADSLKLTKRGKRASED